MSILGERQFGVEVAKYLDWKAEKMKWQPIETAPKDEEIITFVEIASVAIVRNAIWNDGEFWEMQGYDCKEDLVGWWTPTSSCGQMRLEDIFTPTHWMPLPKTPK